MTIYVGWIGAGDAPQDLLADVATLVQDVFGEHPRPWRPAGRPDGAFDPVRGQHSSRTVLAWMREQAPEPGVKILAITDVDLFIPVLTFVFGEAQLSGSTAVVSTARLHGNGADVLRARLRREAVHELGHTFGLVHCASPACVMSRSPTVAAVDTKSDRLCEDCRVRYRERLKEAHYGVADTTYSDRR
jgi:archaemetzincin